MGKETIPMAPSQQLRYEWSPFYRARWERARPAILITASPILMATALAVLDAIVGGLGFANHLGVLLIVVGSITTTLLIGFMEWLDRRDQRRFTAFLVHAKAHGGWWFLRDVDGGSRTERIEPIEAVSEHRRIGLLEPFDPMNEHHRAVTQREIAHLQQLARGSEAVAEAYRTAVSGLETLLVPAAPPA